MVDRWRRRSCGYVDCIGYGERPGHQGGYCESGQQSQIGVNRRWLAVDRLAFGIGVKR